MRVSRQWRDLILWKEFGKGHDPKGPSSQGDLALFCPACPQPGINTPANWQDQPRYPTIPLMKSLFWLSNLWTQLAVPQEHCGGWEFLIGTHEDEKE
jgi:hypothetical protein